VPALFTEAANGWLRAALWSALAAAVGGPSLLMFAARTPQWRGEREPLAQPVAFDHRHHVADDGIDCRFCHESVETSPFAGVPAASVCMRCHGQIWNQSPLLAPVRASYFAGERIRWQRVHSLPGFVYFNHAAHVAGAGIGCVTCHGRVDQMAEVYQVRSLTMGWCLDCHRAPEAHLRPYDEVTNMVFTPPGDAKAYGDALAKARGVRHLTSCTTCHR
jgi:hypothetical protein